MAYAVICLTTSPCPDHNQAFPISIIRTECPTSHHARRPASTRTDLRSCPSCVSGYLLPRRTTSSVNAPRSDIRPPDPRQSLPKSLEHRLALNSLLNAPAVTEPTPMTTAAPFPNPPPAPRSALDPEAFPRAWDGVWREMRIPASERSVAIA